MAKSAGTQGSEAALEVRQKLVMLRNLQCAIPFVLSLLPSTLSLTISSPFPVLPCLFSSLSLSDFVLSLSFCVSVSAFLSLRSFSSFFLVCDCPYLPLRLSLSLCLCLFACLCLALSLSLPLFLSICLSACLPVCLSACLSVCLPVCLSSCLPVFLSICLSACLPVCLSACLSVFLSSCLPVFLSFCLSACLPACRAGWLAGCLPARCAFLLLCSLCAPSLLRSGLSCCPCSFCNPSSVFLLFFSGDLYPFYTDTVLLLL